MQPQDGWVNKKDRKKWEHFSFRTLKKVYDAKVIKAEFLIHHIDQAFEVFEKRSWNKYLPFDDFCELILPYRIGDEPLEEWRGWYRERYESLSRDRCGRSHRSFRGLFASGKRLQV